MARAKQPVYINGVKFDALIEEKRTLEATVPKYPVEDGFVVSETVILSSETLEMTLFVTDTPVTWLSHARAGRTEDVCRDLEALYFQREPVTVITSDATYDSMAIESISFKKTADVGYSKEIPITFIKAIITSAETTDIPESYGKSGATGSGAGVANTLGVVTPAPLPPEGDPGSIA